MDLFFSSPWILPALRRPDYIGFASGGIGFAILELEEGAPEQEHAACATSRTFPGSICIHLEDQACGESPDFAVEWTFLHI